MKPVLFTIGEISVRAYVVLVGLAIIIPVLLVLYNELPFQKRKNSHLHASTLFKYTPEILITTVIFIIIGARIGFVIFNWELYQDDIMGIFRFWRGGFAFHGGLIGALLASTIHAHIRQVPPLTLMDMAMPYAALGYAIGRLGCFLNGCCYGIQTDVPWGMTFPAVDAVTRHPTQLYAVAAGLFIFVVLTCLKHLSPFSRLNGTLLASFLILHSAYRFTVEFYRVTEPVVPFFTWPQLIALGLFILGLILLYLQISNNSYQVKSDFK